MPDFTMVVFLETSTQALRHTNIEMLGAGFGLKDVDVRKSHAYVPYSLACRVEARSI
jgi:hypothetical protein